MKIFYKPKTRVIILTTAFVSIFTTFMYADDLYETFPAQFSLASLNGKNGFTIKDSNSADYSIGAIVSDAGDVNKDGIDDFLVCAGNAKTNGIFEVFVVFGSKDPWPTAINLYDLNGKNGFVINGNSGNGFSAPATRAGDLNGDGIDDILIGVSSANDKIGQSYVVFGKVIWSPAFNLADLNGENGFYINGINPGDGSGATLSGARDINGDGIDDILIGAYGANDNAGQSYIIFGARKPWPIGINLADLDGTNGFSINGINPGDFSEDVSMLGDINVDGIDDLLIGASWANNHRGQSYVVFGAKLWPTSIDLASLNGTNGFAINGINPNDYSGVLVADSNDVNGDGIADFLIGSIAQSNSDLGQIYVIFGSKRPWPATMRLADLNGTNGFIVNGFRGTSSFSASGAGDFNADGITDILIGAYGLTSQVAQTYVIFGHKGLWAIQTNVANLNGTNGFTINGINKDDLISCSVSSAGDINADGVDDILIGASNNNAGQSYIVFGERELNDD